MKRLVLLFVCAIILSSLSTSPSAAEVNFVEQENIILLDEEIMHCPVGCSDPENPEVCNFPNC